MPQASSLTTATHRLPRTQSCVSSDSTTVSRRASARTRCHLRSPPRASRQVREDQPRQSRQVAFEPQSCRWSLARARLSKVATRWTRSPQHRPSLHDQCGGTTNSHDRHRATDDRYRPSQASEGTSMRLRRVQVVPPVVPRPPKRRRPAWVRIPNRPSSLVLGERAGHEIRGRDIQLGKPRYNSGKWRRDSACSVLVG